MTGRAIVVGSVNVDRVLRCPRLPGPGETVLASSSTSGFGGKGGNQAAAAALCGGSAWLVGTVGDDADGRAAVADLQSYGVDTGGVLVRAGTPTGVATVLVDDAGENAIVVAPGANATLTGADVARALDGLDLRADDVVLASAEVGEECATVAAAECLRAGASFLYNIAPARPLATWDSTVPALLIVNEIEAMQATGAATGADAMRRLRERSSPSIVTRGARGAVVVPAAGDRDAAPYEVPAVPATVVDTTGAGDVFCGTVAAELATGADLLDAVRTAVAAAAAAVTAPGARGG